ncbi:helix-turn-helix domain-containing protein [Novosphingobium album (ex Hu et al. 2023)]|uniref:Helix-turn-helix transcriptional regulator n=1 Tax=Novosphingobium album (ex Hu et al. 2023) TaxID=2930093 RepID=A0ABT0B4I0_9SPHN|nr:helix-turn-helix transcriptional regulator [Novosphingobium album (ex Hu et al. 2023)]MCJ2179944.1 helix-turn-helix transcriptional regulator [Novosphingobium album (ex Hu et al. 2023)]
MDAQSPFSARFRLVLKALSLSRAAVAAGLGVDKSLVGRWASGAVKPTDHNLSRITQLIASRQPSFTMADWDRDLTAFASLLGLDPVSSVAAEGYASDVAVLPPVFLEHTRQVTGQRGKTYEGFWRTTRPSVIMDGQFFHDYGMIRITANGMLQVRMGSQGLVFEGYVFPAEGNIFSVLYDTIGATPIFLVFRGVPLPKAHILDGLLVMAALNADRSPAAVPVILERIGDLSGEEHRDDLQCQELFSGDALARREDIDPAVIDHLTRNVGPDAAACGGDMFLTVGANSPFTQGTTLTGQLRG